MAQFCYWQIFNDLDFYLLLGFGCVAFLVLVYTLKQFLQISRLYRRIDKKVFLIYFFCLLWGLLYVAKITYLLLVYATQLEDSQQAVDMFRASQMFCAIDTLPTFFLMYLLILIPYFWLKNITGFLERMKRDQCKDKLILSFFTFYIYLRAAVYLAMFVFEITLDNQDTVETLCDCMIVIILCEVFLSLLLLFYGLIKLFRNFSSLNVNDKKQKRKLIKEYLIMIICSSVRFGMDFYFIIFEKTQTDEPNCFEYRKYDYWYTTLYIILGETLMHLAPIVMILSVYRIDFGVLNKDSFLSDDRNKGRRKISK